MSGLNGRGWMSVLSNAAACGERLAAVGFSVGLVVLLSLGCGGTGDDTIVPAPGGGSGTGSGGFSSTDATAVDTAGRGIEADTACIARCAGRQCGDDGCGGSCGPCADLCSGAADVPALCADGTCAVPCGELRVKATYSGSAKIQWLVAYAFPDAPCAVSLVADPATAVVASLAVQTLASPMALSPVPASGPHNIVVVAGLQGAGGGELRGCTSAVQVAGLTGSVTVPLADATPSFVGSYALESVFDLADKLPPSVQSVVSNLDEMTDDHDLLNEFPANGQYGEDPAAFLLDFIYRQFCCWEAVGATPDWDSCTSQEQTHVVGDLSAIYLNDFTTWIGAQPVTTGLCAALGNGGDPLLQSIVGEVLVAQAPGLAALLESIPKDLAAAVRDLRLGSRLTIGELGLTGSGAFTHTLETAHVTLHDYAGVAHEVDVDLVEAGLTGLSQTGTATTNKGSLVIPKHSFPLELGKLLSWVFESGLLPLLGFDSTEAMLATWVNCQKISVLAEEQVPDFGFLDEKDYEKFCIKGLSQAAKYIDKTVAGFVEGSVLLTIAGHAAPGQMAPTGQVGALEKGIWVGTWSEDGQQGPAPGTFTGTLMTE